MMTPSLQRFLPLFLGLISTSLLVGCGPAGELSSSKKRFPLNEGGIATQGSVAGDWSSHCEVLNDASMGFISLVKTYTFQGNLFSETIRKFSDSRCSRLVVQENANGTFRIATTNNQSKIQFHYTSRVIRVENASQARFYNDNAVCGRTNWDSAPAQDVTAARCTVEMNQVAPFGISVTEKNGQFTDMVIRACYPSPLSGERCDELEMIKTSNANVEPF